MARFYSVNIGFIGKVIKLLRILLECIDEVNGSLSFQLFSFKDCFQWDMVQKVIQWNWFFDPRNFQRMDRFKKDPFWACLVYVERMYESFGFTLLKKNDRFSHFRVELKTITVFSISVLQIYHLLNQFFQVLKFWIIVLVLFYTEI